MNARSEFAGIACMQHFRANSIHLIEINASVRYEHILANVYL